MYLAAPGSTVADVIAGIVLLVVFVVEAVYVLRIAPPDGGSDGEGDGGARVPARPSPKGPPPKAGGRRVDE